MEEEIPTEHCSPAMGSRGYSRERPSMLGRSLALFVKALRKRWPKVKIILRGLIVAFAVGGSYGWCERHDVNYTVDRMSQDTKRTGMSKYGCSARTFKDEIGYSVRIHIDRGLQFALRRVSDLLE